MVGFPEVGVTRPTPILGWNRPPVLATGGFIARTQGIANNLPCSSTKSEPNPDFVRLFRNKGPEFIKFQGLGVRLTGIRIDQGRSE